MNNLNFCGIFADLTMDAINSGSGSEAPILLYEEEKEFNANKILEELKDLQKHVEKLGEIQDRYFDRLEKYYDRKEGKN
jgi:hypothetical protein